MGAYIKKLIQPLIVLPAPQKFAQFLHSILLFTLFIATATIDTKSPL